jgi:hypothetical protein
MSKNDEIILKLKEKIAVKKQEVSKSEKFSPVTNCSLELDSVRYNLHTLTKEQIIYLLAKVRSLEFGWGLVGIDDAFYISGHLVSDWLKDLASKYNVVTRGEKSDQLRKMEAQLDKLLSEEKKTEMLLDDISKLLE